MKQIFLFAASIILHVTTSGQVFEWGIQSGGSGLDVVSDPSGNVYSVGEFQGSAPFDISDFSDSLQSNGGFDYYILKHNSQGEILWARGVGGQAFDWANALDLDANNNIYITGRFEDTVDFDPGPGTYYLNNSSHVRVMFLQKLDENGNLVWAKRVSDRSASEGVDIKVSGNAFYVLGNYRDSVDFDAGPGNNYLYNPNPNSAVFLAKYDTMGHLVWVRDLGEFAASSLALTGSSGVIAVAEGLSESTIARIDSAGNALWTATFSGTTDFASVATDQFQNVYVAGGFSGIVDLDPGPGTHTIQSQTYQDIMIFQLSPAGTFVWSKVIGSQQTEYATEIVTDGLGNLYVGGHFHGKLDFDPSYNDDIHVGQGSQTIFLLKLRANGDHLWSGIMDGDLQYLNGMYASASHHIYLTGNNYENFDADPTAGEKIMMGGSYVVKLDGNTAATGLSHQAATTALKFYPNPCDGMFIVESSSGPAVLLIHDLAGQLVMEQQVDRTQQVRVDLQPGIYQLELRQNEKTNKGKLVIR